MKKIRLSESDLTNLIERVVKEHASAAGFGYGFAKNNKGMFSEDTEGEETYHYGEDEGHDRKEVMGLSDHIKEIKKHLDAIEKDEGYDRDHEDRGEKGTSFMESKIRRQRAIRESKRRKAIRESRIRRAKTNFRTKRRR